MQGGREERPLEKESGSARIKSIAVRGTTSFAPAASFADIASLGVSVLSPRAPIALPYRRPRFSLLRGRIGARTPSLLSASTIVFCFIITAARLRSRRSPRIDDLLLQCRRNSPRKEESPVEGVQRFIAINRRWPVVTSTVRTHPFSGAHFDCSYVLSG